MRAPRPRALPRGCSVGVRALGDHLRKRRLDLGLPQRNVAERLGVREESVRLWELGRARPLPRHSRTIIQFLGYEPEPVGDSLAARLREIRRRLGLTQAELAASLGQDEAQVSRWERGRRRPHTAISGGLERSIRSLEGRPHEEAVTASFFDLTRWWRIPTAGVTIAPATPGERIRGRRFAAGLTASELSRRLGISRIAL